MHPLSHRKRIRRAEKWTSVSPCLAQVVKNGGVGGKLSGGSGDTVFGSEGSSGGLGLLDV